MKNFPYDLAALSEVHAKALQKNFGGDAEKMLAFMCRNVWKKALMDGGQGYLAFGPYWWAIKSIVERVIGSQWGETTSANPVMRKVFMVRSKEHAEALTLLLSDEYRRERLRTFGVSPYHQLDGEDDNEDEYTLEDGDMLQFVFQTPG
jgi:hypothetical protein